MGTTDRTPFPETPGLEPPVERTDFFSSSPVLFSSGHSSGREVKAYVTRDQIRLARKADLAGFLLQRHPDLFRSSGSSLYMKYRDSLYIRKGFPGYTDFSSGRHGNPIDFLTGFLGYSFVDAVSALTGGPSCGRTSRIPRQEDAPPSPIVLPASAKKPYRMVYAYLLGRGIPAGMIRLLEERGLLYQDRDHGNAVFVNPERDCCELPGLTGSGTLWALKKNPGPPTCVRARSMLSACSCCTKDPGQKMQLSISALAAFPIRKRSNV